MRDRLLGIKDQRAALRHFHRLIHQRIGALRRQPDGQRMGHRIIGGAPRHLFRDLVQGRICDLDGGNLAQIARPRRACHNDTQQQGNSPEAHMSVSRHISPPADKCPGKLGRVGNICV